MGGGSREGWEGGGGVGGGSKFKEDEVVGRDSPTRE